MRRTAPRRDRSCAIGFIRPIRQLERTGFMGEYFSACRVSTRLILVIGEKTRRETRREEIFEPHRAMARYHCSKKKWISPQKLNVNSKFPFAPPVLVFLCLRSSQLSLRGELSVSSFRHERETERRTETVLTCGKERVGELQNIQQARHCTDEQETAPTGGRQGEKNLRLVGNTYGNASGNSS